MAYPVSITIQPPLAERNRLTVAFRIFLAIPHFIVLVFLMLAWWVTAFVGWLLILIDRQYPQPLYTFGVGALQ